jgi:subtilisin family serine protease
MKWPISNGFAKLTFGLILLCGLNWCSGQPTSSSQHAKKEQRFHPDRILAQPKAGVSEQEIQKFHASRNFRRMGRFAGLHNLEVLEIARGETVQSAMGKYQRSGLFEFVEPDFKVELAVMEPDDPKFLDGALWGLRNLGQDNGWPGADIRAAEGWAIRHCASNIVVAIVDSGVRYTHEDLAGNLWRHPISGEHGFNAVAGTNDPEDDNGHGTMVAGIIGASGNNGIGVVGVAWNVRIMACKFVDQFGDGTISDAIKCIDYARMNGAHIINTSWGVEEFSISLSNAVHQAGLEGIIVVASAGNRASDTDLYPFYPASLELDHVVSVAATTRTDELFFQSNYGARSVHLGAPGNEIYSTYHRADDAYASRFGTSMAAGYVSGAMALIRAEFPSDPPTRLIHRLLSSTDPLPSLENRSVSGGRLNLFRVLTEISFPTIEARLSASGNSLEFLVVGKDGRNYTIEEGTDLRTWFPVLSGLADSKGLLALTNAIPPHRSALFFRAVEGENSPKKFTH